VRIEDVIAETRHHLELEIDAGGETALVLIDGSPALCVYGRGSVNLPPGTTSIRVLVGDAAKGAKRK